LSATRVGGLFWVDAAAEAVQTSSAIFNNLLTAILGSLELLPKRLPDDPRVIALLDNAMHGAQRGATLTQRRLAFVHCQELKQEAVDVQALMRGMIGLLEQSLGSRIDIQTVFPIRRLVSTCRSGSSCIAAHCPSTRIEHAGISRQPRKYLLRNPDHQNSSSPVSNSIPYHLRASLCRRQAIQSVALVSEFRWKVFARTGAGEPLHRDVIAVETKSVAGSARRAEIRSARSIRPRSHSRVALALW
jgi:hypothetical protein